tara:strand:+ start:304 stop:489 length:186 start_codon:yes stop_codon:yes gene_type:complete
MTLQEILDRITNILYQFDNSTIEAIGDLDLLKHDLENHIIETEDTFLDTDLPVKDKTYRRV